MDHTNFSSRSMILDNIYSDSPKELLCLLDPILGSTGCLRSANDVNLLVKYMEKSSFMVSQCIVISILRNTRAPSTLERFVESKGWAILSNWLKAARDRNEINYLIELIHVLMKFPQTIESLKQGNIGKIIKQLSKSDNYELQKISRNVLIKWKEFLKDNQTKGMINIGGEKYVGSFESAATDPISYTNLKTIQSVPNSFKKFTHSLTEFKPAKSIQRDATLKKVRNNSDLTMNAAPVGKIPKLSQPKYIAPNPDTTLNSPVSSTHCSKFYSSKHDNEKLFPSSSQNSNSRKHSFSSNKSSSVDSKKFSEAIFGSTNRRSSLKRFSNSLIPQRSYPERINDILEHTYSGHEIEIPNSTNVQSSIFNDEFDEHSGETLSSSNPLLRKHVTWAPDESLTQVRYIEFDEAEFTTIQIHGTFHDAILQEKRAERYALAHIFANDRMLALVQWTTPNLIDFLEPLVDSGSKSEESFTQATRERSVLALLFLTKDAAPDDPAEPDIEEILCFKEPRIIPQYEPGKEPILDTNSSTASPGKSKFATPIMLNPSDISTPIFNQIPPSMHNMPLLPIPAHFNFFHSNMPTLNQISCETTDQRPVSNQSNIPMLHSTDSHFVSSTNYGTNKLYPSVCRGNRYSSYHKTGFKNFKPRGRGKTNQLCQHYFKGYCKKGEACDYLH
ncbi:Serine/threonine-protein phosphatase 1 regulatory subunit 10-like [Oopsacas minuta]|uniref:Serine/threonine-protein phosphatase 1 regulatory subunit 10 n=1 Tax=Oopsacas minuta TaxID=111878 RepID=A0AAV7JE93_9METZ|nr:Serine/threonine-protein phosphatase 1 regulatory subunit 10-like [Oopsacas minuta]